MYSYSEAQIRDFFAKNLSDSAFASLAFEAAQGELKRDFDGKLTLVSSSVSVVTPMLEGALFAKPVRLSAKGALQQVCRVNLSQFDGAKSKKRAVAEALYVFQVEANPVESPEDDPENNLAPKSSENLTNTAETRRRQIFEAACNVIAHHGFGNATMREIAREAGISVPLMYKYIKDKDDILYLIMTINMQGMLDFFDNQDFSAGTPEENLLIAIEKYIEYIDDNRKYINLVYSETRSLSPENRLKVFEKERDFMHRWQAIIDDGVSKGFFRSVDTELLSNFIHFLCTVWALRYWSIGHHPVADITNALQEFVLRGLNNESAKADSEGRD